MVVWGFLNHQQYPYQPALLSLNDFPFTVSWDIILCVVARRIEDGLLSVMLAAETQMRCKKKKSLRKKWRQGTSRIFCLCTFLDTYYAACTWNLLWNIMYNINWCFTVSQSHLFFCFCPCLFPGRTWWSVLSNIEHISTRMIRVYNVYPYMKRWKLCCFLTLFCLLHLVDVASTTQVGINAISTQALIS